MCLSIVALLFGLFIVLCGGLDPIISGQGDFVFQYDPDALQSSLFTLMDPEQLLNGHGLCKDDVGNLYFTFQPARVDASTMCLVRFTLNNLTATLIGDPLLSLGVPHGLRIEHDDVQQKSFLYHSNNEATVTKTTLDGEIIWMSNFSDWQKKFPQYWPLHPTDAVVVPNSNFLLVADGYGSSFIHLLDKYTGEYMGKSWGGSGNGNFPLKLSVPHGINVDLRASTKTPIFVISDRSNHRFVWADQNGNYVKQQYIYDNGMTYPCNVDLIVDKFTKQMVGVVPSLGDWSGNPAFINGSVAIYGSEIAEGSFYLKSIIGVEKYLGIFGHQHPHDAVLLSNGDLVVCCWSGPSDGDQFGPAKGTISYWRRKWN